MSSFPDIKFLTETKTPDDVVLETLKWMEYGSHKLVSPHSSEGGGLTLFWKKEIDVNIISSSENFLDTTISYKKKMFYTTFVYRHSDHKKRKAMWDELTNITSTRSDAWYLTGDYNEILNNSEKRGGIARTKGSFCDFRTFMLECDLYDLRYSGKFL